MSQTQASAKYNAKTYEEIKLRVKKGNKEKIKRYADEHGESLNGFINRAIKESMEKDNSNG